MSSGQQSSGYSYMVPVPVPTPPSPAQALRRKVRWVELPDQETYPGWQVLMWVNFPASFMEAMRELAASSDPGSELKSAELMSRIFVEHNGWRDEQDNVMPPTSSPEFYAAIPQEIQVLLGALIRTEVAKLPNLLPSPTPSTNGSTRRRAVL